jgi:hypothetical protein
MNGVQFRPKYGFRFDDCYCAGDLMRFAFLPGALPRADVVLPFQGASSGFLGF